MTTQAYDILIIGAGPNGLTCGAYLARTGARVALLERFVETGGGLVTEEHAGFRFNHHATYMMLAELMPPYHDLNLRDRGAVFIRPEAQVAFLFEGGKSFTLYTDLARSKASIARLSPTDAEVFARMYGEFKEMCDRFLIPATYTPPVEPIEQITLLQNADHLGQRIAEISEISPREVIASYGFQDPRVEAAMLYLATMFGIDPDEGGLGFMVPLYVYRLTNAALVKGGSHQLSSALRRELEGNGGEVLNSAEVTAILVEDGVARGVTLADGREIRAGAVISTLNPHQNFLALCDGQKVAPEVARAAESWLWEEWSHFVSGMAYLGEPPRYEGYDPEVNAALTVVMGFETPQDIVDDAEAVKAGRMPAKLAGHGSCISLFDPLQVPSHLARFGPYSSLRWECWAPYNADWESLKKDLGKQCLERWRQYAPNLSEDNVHLRINWSPVDIETRLPTMKNGSIKHGAYTSFQMGYNRPSVDCSSYRTPIQGLYVAGASTHPGGMVILGPGYNAARTVAEDLGLDIWWETPPMVRGARELGYLQ